MNGIILTAVKTPFDLMKFDSEAASLIMIPWKLSLNASPVIYKVRIKINREVKELAEHVFEFALYLCALHHW